MLVREVSAQFYGWVLKHKSANTHRYYTGRLSKFDLKFGDREATSLTKNEIEDYLDWVNFWEDGTAKAPDTIRANIVSFEQWQKWAIKREVIPKAIITDLEKPVGRQRERLPTPSEVEQIKAESDPAFVLVYQALRQCGARPNELARATTENWDKANGMIVLREHKTAKKTGRAREIAVGDKMLALIMESMGERTEGHLFLTPRGKPWTPASLSATFRRARDRAELDRELVIYSARHEHGTACYHSHGELAAATALGHAGTGMLKRYAKITPQQRRATQDACGI